MTTNKNTRPQFVPTKPHIRPWVLDWGILWICEEPLIIVNGLKYCTGESPKEAYENYVEEYLNEQQTAPRNT